MILTFGFAAITLVVDNTNETSFLFFFNSIHRYYKCFLNFILKTKQKQRRKMHLTKLSGFLEDN